VSVVAALHPPFLHNLFETQTTIGIVIAEHMQGYRMRFLELLHQRSVLFFGLGEVAQLDDGIGWICCHRLEESIEACWRIVHHVMMKIGDQPQAHRFGHSGGGRSSSCG